MTTHTRFIIITTDTGEKIVFAYDAAVYDSYALHLAWNWLWLARSEALTAIDPGDEYKVKFTNQRPRRGKNVWFEAIPLN